MKAAPAGAANTDERLSRTPLFKEFMHMTIVSKDPTPASAPNDAPLSKKEAELADAAVMLLPGLQQSRLLLDTAIQVLSHFAPPPPQGTVGKAEAAARIRRALAEFGHPSVRR
jgi:hypothetical protein